MSSKIAKAKDIFLDLMTNVSPDGWDEAITCACAGDDVLRERVRALLQAHAEPDDFLDDRDGTQAHSSALEAVVVERPGAVIGPYKLLQQIGEGGMGIVFMAEQTEPINRKVALKIIKAGMDTRQVIARFEAERQALALMDHPNIARVLDAGTTETGRPYFVMELVKGVPITRYCDEKRLPFRDRLRLILPVCRAVQHAHQKGIIHRDIKPSNVLVAEYDNRAVPKVIDFGVAKATGQKLTDRTMFTEFGQVLGTVEYMSPEQAKFNQLDVDTRSDIYSLGVLVYELVTGQTPFDRKRLRSVAIDEVLRIIREEDPPKPSTRLSMAEQLPSFAASHSLDSRRLSGLVKGEMDWIVMKALEKDRARRYETADALAADVERFLHNEVVQASPPSATYRLRKLARRYRTPLTITAAFVLLLAVASVVSTWQAIRATQAEQQVTRERDQVIAEKRQKDIALGQKQEALSQKQRALDEATRSKKTAQERLAAGLIAEGDSLLNSGRASQARDSYWQALDLSRELGLSQFAAASGLVESYAVGAPPLMGSEGVQSGVGGFKLSNQIRKPVMARALAFSSDGRTAAAGGSNSQIVLWDVATGLPVRTLTGHTHSVRSVAFSPDGRNLLSGSSDSLLKLWDVKTGKVIRSFTGHTMPVNNVAFSPDGKTAVSGGQDWAIILWDTATGKAIRQFARSYNPVSAVAISPDGKTIATTGTGGGVIEIWDAETGRKRGRLSELLSALVRLAFSPDGKMLLAGGLDRDVCLWDLESGKVVRKFGGRGRAWSTMDLAYSPDGRFALCGGSDGTCRLYDVKSGEQVGSFSGHSRYVTAVAFSSDSRSFLSADKEGSIKLWSVQPDRGTEFVGHSDRVVGLSIAPNGFVAASGGLDRTIRLWDMATGKSLGRAETDSDVYSVVVSPDGRYVLTGQSGNQIVLWDSKSLKALRTFEGHGNTVTNIALATDGRTFLSASSDKTIKLWDLTLGKEMRTYSGHHDKVRAVAFSPDGKRMLSGSFDQTMKLWDVASGNELRTFSGHEHWVQCVAFSPDGRNAASGSWDNTVALWDLDTGKCIGVQRANSSVSGVAFSPDGHTVLASCFDRSVYIWNIAGSDEMRSLGWQDEGLASAAFSPDAKTALLGSTTGPIWRRDFDRATKYRSYDEQLPAARKKLSQNLSDANALHEFAKWYAFRGVDDWAVEFFEKAKASGADVSNLDLARCYWRLGRLADAKREFHTALERREAPAEYLARCLQALDGKVPEADAATSANGS
jgi:WD40 repeat protein/serine/threonine protein kinase